MTHIRYEEGKETQVGDGDRELSRLPGPAGSMGRESAPPERLHNLLGFELLFGHKIKTQTPTHAHPYTHT